MPVIINGIHFADRSEIILDGVSHDVDSIDVKSTIHPSAVVWVREIMPVIPNFYATEDQFAQVTFAWDMNSDALSWDIYETADMTTPILTNVTSPHVYTFSGSGNFVVRANANPQVADNYSDSEPDRGEGLVADAGNVTISYNSISGANPETVSGSGYSFGFTPPAGIINGHVQMVSGGGGGGGGESGGTWSSGEGNGGSGGHVGNLIDSDVVFTVDLSHALIIGQGGGGGEGGDTGDYNNGHQGLGGTASTYNDGELNSNGGLGGGAGGVDGSPSGSSGSVGDSTVFGNGGAGGARDHAGLAGTNGSGGGGGGGGDNDTTGDGETGGGGGRGGHGYIVISWKGVGKN